jgi:hypothetical protein
MPSALRSWSCQFILSVLTAACVMIPSLQAQLPERMVIGTGVVCRDEPKTSAKAVHVYQLGDLIAASSESTDGSGVWYFDEWHVSGQSPTCWIFGPLTTSFTPSNPVPALLAAVDHVLGRPSSEVRFEDYVAVENLLGESRFSGVTESSGILQLRRLTIIDRAVSQLNEVRLGIQKEPLKYFWIMSHSKLFTVGFGDEWLILPGQYWRIYNMYKQEPWAEEAAWAAANAHIPADECYASCVLNNLGDTYMLYWMYFPDGTHLNAALDKAAEAAKYAASVACYTPGDAYSVPRELLTEFRNSLQAAASAEKTPLLDYLNQIEAKCYPSKP